MEDCQIQKKVKFLTSENKIIEFDEQFLSDISKTTLQFDQSETVELMEDEKEDFEFLMQFYIMHEYKYKDEDIWINKPFTSKNLKEQMDLISYEFVKQFENDDQIKLERLIKLADKYNLFQVRLVLMGTLFMKYIIFDDEDYQELIRKNQIKELTFKERNEIIEKNPILFKPLEDGFQQIKEKLISDLQLE